MNDYKEEIFNKTPLLINVDEWLSGKHQILYITGLSGGGKGYYAKQYAEKRPGTIIIELDKFENYQWFMGERDDNPAVARGDRVIFSYLKNKYGATKKLNIFDASYDKYNMMLMLFYSYIIDYAYEHPETPFIIEGIQIFSDKAFRTLTNDESIIIIRTAAVKDMTKVMDRPHPVFRNHLHTFNDAQQKLRDFESRLQVDEMKAVEAAQIDPATGGFKNPKDLSDWMKTNIRYTNFTRLQDVTKTIQTRKGSCHDQVVFEIFFLNRMKLQHGAYFLIETDVNRQGGVTHSFVWYKSGNKYYWLENAWEEKAGIHEFNSLTDMTNEFKKMHKNREFGNYAKYPILNIAFFDYRAGDTLQQMVNRIFKNK